MTTSRQYLQCPTPQGRIRQGIESYPDITRADFLCFGSIVHSQFAMPDLICLKLTSSCSVSVALAGIQEV